MAAEAINDRYCRIDGLNIRYWIAGNGKKSVVLIHGLGGSLESWFENMAPLSRDFTVYAVELPGHGKSDKPDVRYTLEFFTDFIGKFMEEFRIAPCHIIGLSFGGGVALRFTLRSPDKVDKLVLVSSAGLGPGMGLLFSLASMAPVRSIMGAVPRWVFAVYAKSTVYDSRKIPSQIIGFYFDLLKTRDFRQVLLSMQRESFTFFGHSGTAIRDVAASLNMIDKKTLIIWGKNDTMIPVANAYRGHKLIANSQLTIFDRCSHNPQYEKALEFNALVSEFLLNS